MFELVHLQDTVHIPPSEFGTPLLKAITDALAEKFSNKVLPGIGLCVTTYDILHIGESQLYPGNGSHHTAVEFRLVVFRPYPGEVMTGTVVSCDRSGVRVSLGFFDEIHVPARLLQQPSSWSDEEGVWVWDVTSDHQLFLDLENPLRFRVEQVKFREASNTSSHAKWSGQQQDQNLATGTPHAAATPGASGGPTPKRSATPVNVGMASERMSDGRATGQPAPAVAVGRTQSKLQTPAMSIVASIDRAGLGLSSWWPPDDLEDDEEEEPEDAVMAQPEG